MTFVPQPAQLNKEGNMLTVENEFNEFYKQSYGPVKPPISEGQQREIKMNFYSGMFVGTMNKVNPLRQQFHNEASEWIRKYIDERAREDMQKVLLDSHNKG